MTDLATQHIPLPEGIPPPSLVEESIASLRKALNAPSLPEVKNLIEEEILNYNMLNKIELKKGDDPPIMLGDEPRHYLFPEILTTVHHNLPAALIGPAGSGKSTVMKQIAEALKLKFYLQNSVSGPHELTGYTDAHGKYVTTPFRDAYEKGGFLFIDEVDTSDAAALKWVNTAIANGYATFPDKADPIMRHPDFRIAIAANTYGRGSDRMYVGANQLDASTLDRFVFFDFDYDELLELGLSGNDLWAKHVQRLRHAAMEERARIVISPRATINGAKLIAAGWDWDKVEDRVIWKGIDPDLKERINLSAKAVSNAEAKSASVRVKSKAERKAIKRAMAS